MYVCSDSSSSCPAVNTAATSNQGDFTITQNDGPIQFLIDESVTTSSLTFNPFSDSFAKTSQYVLDQDNNDFSSDETDPRIYIYSIVSPGYERLWVHSGLAQYLQARPWLLSIFSLSILKPKYIR